MNNSDISLKELQKINEVLKGMFEADFEAKKAELRKEEYQWRYLMLLNRLPLNQIKTVNTLYDEHFQEYKEKLRYYVPEEAAADAN